MSPEEPKGLLGGPWCGRCTVPGGLVRSTLTDGSSTSSPANREQSSGIERSNHALPEAGLGERSEETCSGPPLGVGVGRPARRRSRWTSFLGSGPDAARD